MSDNYPQVGGAFIWQFKMVDDGDGKTAETGLTPVVTINKDGAGFASLTGSPAVTELALGWYEIVVPAADMASRVILRATDATSRDSELQLSPGGDWLAVLVGKKTFDRNAQTVTYKDPGGSTTQITFTYGQVDNDTFTWTSS